MSGRPMGTARSSRYARVVPPPWRAADWRWKLRQVAMSYRRCLPRAERGRGFSRPQLELRWLAAVQSAPAPFPDVQKVGLEDVHTPINHREDHPAVWGRIDFGQFPSRARRHRQGRRALRGSWGIHYTACQTLLTTCTSNAPPAGCGKRKRKGFACGYIMRMSQPCIGQSGMLRAKRAFNTARLAAYTASSNSPRSWASSSAAMASNRLSPVSPGKERLARRRRST